MPDNTSQYGRLLDARQVKEHLKRPKDGIRITPIIDDQQIGATVDLRLGTEFVVKKMDRLPSYDPILFHKERNHPSYVSRFYETIKKLDPTEPFFLHPGGFALGSTLEYIELPATIGALLEGRSGWAREGLNVHSTAGIIHPGHKGLIVFELQNLGTHPLPLYPGVRVAQLLFYEFAPNTTWAYDGVKAKYAQTMETSYGRPWEDWEFSCLSAATPRPPT